MSKDTSSRIKELRIRKGFSQEGLAEGTGLNLRTIQRIENGETAPLGNSVRRIADVLGTSPEELMNPERDADDSLPTAVNLSALAFLLFPMLGAILPYILFRATNSRANGLDQIGRDVVNFQITWILIYYIGLFAISAFMFPMLYVILMYGVNIILILLNTLFIHTKKKTWYYPRISFL